ncbi:hypothetical protein ACP26L_20885 [Paenibacillus sp. S-38]|uniref:hypothetical protein n=1 Tax=Paenibacillus sp. S-38 TaxID=3416710 RepID=UPI003CEC147F
MKQKDTGGSHTLWAVEAETGCPQGEAGSAGRRTVVTFHNRGATAWVQVDKDEDHVSYLIHSPDLLQVELFGDAAAEQFIEALERAAENLRKQLKPGRENGMQQSIG